jgi:hypothetical protein
MFLIKAVCNTCGRSIDRVEQGLVFYSARCQPWALPDQFVIVHTRRDCADARNALNMGIWERTTLAKFLLRLPQRDHFRYAQQPAQVQQQPTNHIATTVPRET